MAHDDDIIGIPSIEPEIEAFIRKQGVARLATADGEGRPSLVPVCFVFTEGRFYSPIDDKRKNTSWGRLKRLRNIEVNPNVCLLLDHYSRDWTELRWVLIRGVAEVISPPDRFAKEHAEAIRLLRRKYPQYENARIGERPLIRIVPRSVTSWSA
ncbi:MAG TPA: TIGR03668 family PPOX class F420-dependent oxidoreductase [Vicinamibacteria bacterium]|nr:TIGR03668 family PPOX class F420-dependent oxidoreductase [Vicinamibacteria bacterium]